MISRFILLVFFFSFFANMAYSQDTTAMKALYVENLEDIIDIESSENELLNYARSNGFNYLIIDDISKVHKNRFPLDSEMTDDPFVQFMIKAKSQYNIKRIVVADASLENLNPLLIYNKNHRDQDAALVDGLCLHFEFWRSILTKTDGDICDNYLSKRGLPCNRSGAFYFYMEQLKLLRSVVNQNNIDLESYVGSVSRDEMQRIIQYLDVIHLEYFGKNAKKVTDIKNSRLKAIIDSKSEAKIIPLFSSEEKYLNKWVQKNGTNLIYTEMINALESEKALKPAIKNIWGFGWYHYNTLPR
jgi:uncharacterized protein YktA (UPF0223 family)